MTQELYQGEASLAPMTPKEASSYLGWGVETLSKWRRNKNGPLFSVKNRRIYYFKHDLDEFLSALARNAQCEK